MTECSDVHLLLFSPILAAPLYSTTNAAGTDNSITLKPSYFIINTILSSRSSSGSLSVDMRVEDKSNVCVALLLLIASLTEGYRGGLRGHRSGTEARGVCVKSLRTIGWWRGEERVCVNEMLTLDDKEVGGATSLSLMNVRRW
ncbi:hypothetical protein Tco_0335322 [Tanacetum coccineum]